MSLAKELAVKYSKGKSRVSSIEFFLDDIGNTKEHSLFMIQYFITRAYAEGYRQGEKTIDINGLVKKDDVIDELVSDIQKYLKEK